MTYIPTIGLEIHAELKTKSKMFCSCLNDSLEQHPNVNICPICMGHPGTLPVANEEAVRLVQKVGLALHCEIAEYSKFDRKSYFYPDLPKGYQISQYDLPFCKGGSLKIRERIIHITRVHLEEDTGKLLHAATFGPAKIPSGRKVNLPLTEEYSLIDFNRAGVPLMELVTEPEITSGHEASIFAQELQLILRYLGASDANMEKGQMRVEANISVRPEGQEQLGTKVEVKNLNSFHAVEQAIEYEIKRQTELLEEGEGFKIVQVTMGWNTTVAETYVQREKEEAHDYRYFPEPDLPPFHFTKEEIEKLRAELPQARRERFLKEYKLSEKEVEILVQEKDLGEYFEKVVSELGPNLPREKLQKLIKLSSNYIISDLLGLLSRYAGSRIAGQTASVVGEDFLITPENFAELILLIEEGKVSSAIAKQVLKEMFAKGGDPSHIIEEKGLAQVTNEKEIEKIAKEIISKNPKAVQDYKKGKQNALQFLVGQLMAKTQDKASPDLAGQILHKLLE